VAAAVTSPRDATEVVAHSAQLTLTAASSDHTLSLRVTRVSSHQPIAGPGRVTASLDGHAVRLAAGPDGTYLLSLRHESGGAHELGVVVAHDGIRELLTGTVTVPRQQSIIDSIQSHGMSAWWVLNVAVVLIAVLVISRRRG
jgi:hypothetical protein